MQFRKLKLLNFFLFFFFAHTSSEKILFLLPIATKSHKNVFEPLVTALAERGHEVTVVSPGYLSKPVKTIREIVPITYEDIARSQGKGGFTRPLERRSKGKIGSLLSVNFEYAFQSCDIVYQNVKFQELLIENFDLVFLNGFVNNCFEGFIHKLGAPFIIITTMAAPNVVTYAVGNYLPPSFVPFCLSDYSDNMNFVQRTLNFIYDQYFGVVFTSLFVRFGEIYKKNLGANFPDVVTLEKNVSMIFSNSNFALTYPRPLLPDIVEVGGMHCRPAKSLPQNLDEFLSGAKHGFIYFSLGSVVNTDDLPDDVRLKFLNVFSRLKQRVIWKWNSGYMYGLPENVRVNNWLPQQDILGHRNIRVFMTHGGLLSTQEAAYHGVPLIGIPIFADQDLNVKQAVNKGYALQMEILEFTEQILAALLNEILNEPNYAAEAAKLSLIVKDQPQTPLQRAVYWSEYVIRHKGAHHMRSAARHLNYFQYHSLDVIFFLGNILLLLTCLLVVTFKHCRKICNRS